MSVYVNHKEYEYIENISIFNFIRHHQLFLPFMFDNELDELCYVEVIGMDNLVSAKTTNLEDGMQILTQTEKIYTYLETVLSYPKRDITSFMRTMSLDETAYNILLCAPECYEKCLETYKDKGFNDIISLKLFQMVRYLELTHEFMKKIANRLDHLNYNKLLVLEPSIIEPPLNITSSLKPAEEIASILLKTYYKQILKVTNDIHIIYVTNDIKEFFCQDTKSNLYLSMIDEVVLENNFEITNTNSLYDGKITNEIYKKKTTNLTISCDYSTIFKILRKMGLKEESLEVFDKDQGTSCFVTYKGLSLKILFTTHLFTKEVLDTLDYDLVVICYHEYRLNEEYNEILTDYNLNHLYKKLLIFPGHSDIFRRK